MTTARLDGAQCNNALFVSARLQGASCQRAQFYQSIFIEADMKQAGNLTMSARELDRLEIQASAVCSLLCAAACLNPGPSAGSALEPTVVTPAD